MIVFIILVIINILIIKHTEEPKILREVKEKYTILRNYIKENDVENLGALKTHIPITGIYGLKGMVGYNTNKGGDIVVCLDGSANQVFHVLLHELAHCTVKEYDHSEQFWSNYIQLRDLCVNLGIYEKIPERTPFCGEHVQDK